MNREFRYYSDSVSAQNEKLNLELISLIDEKCRKERSEAIYQAFASLLPNFRALSERLAKLVKAESSGQSGNNNLSASVPYRRFNLHTE